MSNKLKKASYFLLDAGLFLCGASVFASGSDINAVCNNNNLIATAISSQDFKDSRNTDSINVTGGNGWTTLMWPAAFGEKARVEFLVKNNANIAFFDKKNKRTALDLAVIYGQVEIEKYLIEKNAPFMNENLYGTTALGHTLIYGKDDVSKYLATNKSILKLKIKKEPQF